MSKKDKTKRKRAVERKAKSELKRRLLSYSAVAGAALIGASHAGRAWSTAVRKTSRSTRAIRPSASTSTAAARSSTSACSPGRPPIRPNGARPAITLRRPGIRQPSGSRTRRTGADGVLRRPPRPREPGPDRSCRHRRRRVASGRDAGDIRLVDPRRVHAFSVRSGRWDGPHHRVVDESSHARQL